MKKLRFCSFVLALAIGCTSPFSHEKTYYPKQAKSGTANYLLREIINYDSIELKPLDEIEFLDEKISLAFDLEWLINNEKPYQIYRDKEKFREKLYQKYKLSKEKLRNMPALDLIVLSADIVADNFSYENKDFPIDSFIEDNFEDAKGDCTAYADNMIHILNLLKEDNEKTRNVYIGKAVFGKLQLHDWNAIYILSKNKLQIGMIDANLYEEERKLNALDREHVDNLWKIKFFRGVRDHGQAYKQACMQIENASKDERKKLLFEKAFSLYLAGKFKSALADFQELESYEEFHSTSLYYQGLCSHELGNKKERNKKLKELLEKYKEDYFSKSVIERGLLE